MKSFMKWTLAEYVKNSELVEAVPQILSVLKWMVVVYFDQQTSAPHAVRWLK